MAKTTCSRCGKTVQFNPRSSLPEPICRPCRRQERVPYGTRSGVPLPSTFTCGVCGIEFSRPVAELRPGRLPKVCSQRCAMTRARQMLVTVPERPCLGCGATVTSSGSKVLCTNCREARKREWGRRKNRVRRALLRGAVSEPYTLAEIAERDDWCCQLCDEPVDMTIPAPEPWSPSIDHIVALSNGGDDTPANAQLAHRRCNTSKGARDVQQLAMAG